MKNITDISNTRKPTAFFSVLSGIILLFTLFVLLAFGTGFYQSQEKAMQKGVEKNLAAIAQLKADQIIAWRKDQLDDAVTLVNPFLLQSLIRFMSDPDEEEKKKLIMEFKNLATQHDYMEILLISPDGRILLGMEESFALHTGYLPALESAFKQRKPVFVDLHRETPDDKPHISVISPLFSDSGQNPGAPIGALVFVNDPLQFLYPLIQSWPTADKTAETLLVRQDNDQVLFLNDLRHQPDAALRLRIPMSETEVPAVMALHGKTGYVRGWDYRGVETVAVILPIPDSPWFMVAKIDMEEAFADWRFRSILILSLILGLTLLVGIVGMVIRQREKKVHFRD
ncbi:MAG: cache domain-containing protein, partial [Desulfobacula sp.]